MYSEANPELNQIDEEDYDLYADELDEAERVFMGENENTGALPEENVEDFIEGVFSTLTKTIKSIASQIEQAPDDSGYIPSMADFNHPFNRALRWGYGKNQSIQSIRLGPQLLVRASSAPCLDDSLFEEFWLDDDAVRASQALCQIRSFLDQHEDDFDPIPEHLLAQARMENPNTTIKTYRDFIPYGGYGKSQTPESLKTALRCIDTLPIAIKHLTQVLGKAVHTVDDAFARMNPTGDCIERSQGSTHSFTGIASINIPPPAQTKSKPHKSSASISSH